MVVEKKWEPKRLKGSTHYRGNRRRGGWCFAACVFR